LSSCWSSPHNWIVIVSPKLLTFKLLIQALDGVVYLNAPAVLVRETSESMKQTKGWKSLKVCQRALWRRQICTSSVKWTLVLQHSGSSFSIILETVVVSHTHWSIVLVEKHVTAQQNRSYRSSWDHKFHCCSTIYNHCLLSWARLTRFTFSLYTS
jgi:hypothetical protein